MPSLPKSAAIASVMATALVGAVTPVPGAATSTSYATVGPLASSASYRRSCLSPAFHRVLSYGLCGWLWARRRACRTAVSLTSSSIAFAIGVLQRVNRVPALDHQLFPRIHPLRASEANEDSRVHNLGHLDSPHVEEVAEVDADLLNCLTYHPAVV